MRISPALVTLAFLSLLGCGGGGGGGEEGRPPDLSGWYALSQRPAGSSAAFTVSRYGGLDDGGDRLWWIGEELVWTGDVYFSARPDETSPDRREIRLWRVSDDHFEGFYDDYTVDVLDRREVRLLPHDPPDGMLTMHGTVDGESIDVDTTNAYIQRVTSSSAVNLVLTVFHAHLVQSTHLLFPVPPAIDEGTYLVQLGDVSVSVITEQASGSADAGTVTITHIDAERVVGTLELSFSGGETIDGDFDLPILVEL